MWPGRVRTSFCLANDLARLVDTLVVAKRTRGIIWQNFAGTVIVDLVGMGLAAIGTLGPLLAAFIQIARSARHVASCGRAKAFGVSPHPRALTPRGQSSRQTHSTTKEPSRRPRPLVGVLRLLLDVYLHCDFYRLWMPKVCSVKLGETQTRMDFANITGLPAPRDGTTH